MLQASTSNNKYHCLGEVAVVVGGFFTSTTFSGPVEVFSPNGHCNYQLASLPKAVFGNAIFLYNGSIAVCGGYGNQVLNFHQCQCKFFPLDTLRWQEAVYIMATATSQSISCQREAEASLNTFDFTVIKPLGENTFEPGGFLKILDSCQCVSSLLHFRWTIFLMACGYNHLDQLRLVG